jgi:XTP/dITP diphosphohydrolase
MKLLVATTNPDKIREIRAVLEGAPIDLITLADIPSIAAPDETGRTFWENARQKALAYARASGLIAAAEDSGLEIAALGGEPGVLSARFLSADAPYPARFEEIYKRLGATTSVPRDARFVTALTVARPDGTILFETEASIDGEIADRPAGRNGFGYDPIFFYRPLARTTAQLTLEEKCAVSHRARAFRDLAAWCESGARERRI